MDHSITDVRNVCEGFEFYLFVKNLMTEGSFNVRKWNKKCQKLLRKIDQFENICFDETPKEKS